MVIAIIALLAALLLPVLGKSKAKAEGVTCAHNLQQVSLAWILYAEDNGDLLVNNHGVPETLARRQTWANNVEDWLSSDDNTNLVSSDRLQARALRQPIHENLQVPIRSRTRPQRPAHPQRIHECHGG